MDNPVVKAFKAWRDAPTQDCCTAMASDDSHYAKHAGRLVKKPDSMVCIREQLWRAYCRLRDNDCEIYQ